MNKRLNLTIAGLTIGFVLTQAFQNCAQPFELASLSGDADYSMGADHPGNAVVGASTQSPLLVNRVYMTNLFNDVFLTSASTAGEKTTLTNITNQWFTNKTSAFGYPCDIKTGVNDCNGTILAPMNTGTNTLRAAFKSQACQSVLSNDTFVNNFVSHVSVVGSAPTATSIELAFSMFYRGDDANPGLIQGLAASDRMMYEKNPSISGRDRWRYLILAICESSGWEQL
ncbi:hypothetical protein [Bdellovibrio sp. HCB274]|uniref:hypothetical protein n=1 Tax=Bdellovibrio sp. HCB274 TaxID=3394361 RepID=UPI0039B667F8